MLFKEASIRDPNQSIKTKQSNHRCMQIKSRIKVQNVIGNSNLSYIPKVASQWKLQTRIQGRMTPNVFQDQKLQRNTPKQRLVWVVGWVGNRGLTKQEALLSCVNENWFATRTKEIF